MNSRLILVVALLSSACAPMQTARRTAETLGATIDEYRTSVAATLDAEERFYQEAADAISKARHGISVDGLVALRLEQERRFIDWLVDDPAGRSTRSGLSDFLQKATQAERAAIDRLRAQSDGARVELLAQIGKFERQSKELDEVLGQLQQLAQDKRPLDHARFLIDFLEGVRDELDEMETKKESQK